MQSVATTVTKPGEPIIAPAGFVYNKLSFCAVGAGQLKQFSVNGNVKFKRIRFKKGCVIFPGIGLICDGRRRCIIKPRDVWSAQQVTAAVTFNGADKNKVLQIASSIGYRPETRKQRKQRRQHKKKKKD